MDNNELYHHGVKGMKWGVRRTPDQLAASRRKRDMSNLSGMKTIAERSADISRESAKIAGNVANSRRPSKAVEKQLSQMTDQELRSRINRMQMEQQYASMNPSRTARGAAVAQGILNTAGSVLAIGGSALSIALAIKALKG